MLKIKKVTHLKDYKLKIIFNNNVTKNIDFEGIIAKGGFYLDPLKDLEFFKKVTLDEFQYTICWPESGTDFCPDMLYELGEIVKKRRKTTVQRKKKKLKTRTNTHI